MRADLRGVASRRVGTGAKFLLIVETRLEGVDAARQLARALKSIKRGHGFRCVHGEAIDPAEDFRVEGDEGAVEPTNESLAHPGPPDDVVSGR